MRKALWTIPMLLLIGALGAPYAHADAIVQVTISNLTFNGNHTCGASGTALCTQTLSASFQWDNSNNTYVAGSSSFTTVGDLGTSFFLDAGIPKFQGNYIQYSVSNSTSLPSVYATLVVDLGVATGPLVNGIYTPANYFTWTGANGQYASVINCTGSSSPCVSEGFAPSTSSTGGTVSVAPVLAPEPATCSLTMIGIGLLGLVMRKRIAQALPRAT